MINISRMLKISSTVLLSLISISCGLTTSPPGNTNSNGQLSLAIQAPSSYPAGLPVPMTVTLTMINTSNVNATNLVYSVPDATNYTGVTITPYPDGLGNNCQNILAGKSCQFTVVVEAYANPGSFTVDAAPQSANNLMFSTDAPSSMASSSNSISVTTNLSLVKVPENNTSPFYVFPESQTINIASNGSATAYVSVLVESNASQFSYLKLVDGNGNNLNAELIGTSTNNESYGVNSYSIIIPGNISTQQIQVKSFNVSGSTVCTSECSNMAAVNLAQANLGILQVQPYSFSMSPTYESQVITLINTGDASLNGSLPTFSAPFSIINNNCGDNYTLAPNGKCTFTLLYSPTSSSGQGNFVFTYNNGQVALTVPYTGNPPPAPVYAYLISGDTAMVVCTLSESNGGYTNCISNRIAYQNQYSLTFFNTDNVTYAYIGTAAGQSTPIPRCVYSPTDGNLSSCIDNAINDQIPSWGTSYAVSFHATNAINYAYVATGGTYSDGITNGVYKCNVESNAMLSGCIVESAASTDGAYQATFATVNGTDYMYVIQETARDILVCTLNSTGDTNSCQSANYPIAASSYPNPFWMEFQTINGTQYAYIPDQTPSFFQCQLATESGTLTNCNNLIPENSTAQPEAQFALISLNNVLYSYIMDYSLGATCNTMTSSGALDAGDITGDCGVMSISSYFNYGVALSPH